MMKSDECLSLYRYRSHAQSSLGGHKVRGASPIQRPGANSPVVSLSQGMAAISVSARGRTESGSPVTLCRAPTQSELDQSPNDTPGLEAVSTVGAIDPRHSSSEELSALASARKWSGNPMPSHDNPCIPAEFDTKEQPVHVLDEGDYWQHSAQQRLHYHSAGDLTNPSLEVHRGGPDRDLVPSTLLSVQEDETTLNSGKVLTYSMLESQLVQ